MTDRVRRRRLPGTPRRLIDAAQQGDREAQHELLRAYEPLVQRVVWRRVHGHGFPDRIGGPGHSLLNPVLDPPAGQSPRIRFTACADGVIMRAVCLSLAT
jgi:Helix-turn-helix domain